MQLTPVERLILLKLTQLLERMDMENAKEHDADAQALEQGTPAGIARMFECLAAACQRAFGWSVKAR